MAAKNTEEGAMKQGRDLALMLREIFMVNPEAKMGTIRQYAMLLAEEQGYRDPRLFNQFVDGFSDGLKMTEEELKALYSQGSISLEMFSKFMQKMIEGPKE